MHPEYRLLHISLPSRYAISAATRLAMSDGEFMMVEKIASPGGLPPAYLSKVLRRLARAGVLESRRGAKGGYRLGRPASEITVTEVIAAARDDDDGPMPCMLESRACDSAKPCALHPLVEDTERPLWRRLDSTTLADLAARSSNSKPGDS